MFDAVSFTVLTTLLITLRAPETAPPFFEPPPRFFDEAFFAGALAGAFFDAAFFAGAFFEAFFDDAFFEEAEAFFDDAFFEAFLLAPPFFEDDFFAADFFDDDDFFDADFFADDFLEDDFFADFFLAAMDSSPIQNRVGGEPYVVRKKKICAAWQPRCTNFNVDEDVAIVTHASLASMAHRDVDHRLRRRRSVLHLLVHPQSQAHARAGQPRLARADHHPFRSAIA